MKNIILAILLFYSLGTSAAWDDGAGIATGIISAVDVTGGNNYGFRVYLEGTPAMCSGGDKWAYINEQDSNYNVKVSTLLASFSAGKKVTIYSNTISDTSRCHIGYIRVNK